MDERILVLEPTDNNGVLDAEILREAGLRTRVCKDLIEMGEEMQRGAGALVLAEEALLPAEVPALANGLARELPWSDVPVIILTRGRDSREESQVVKTSSSLGNVILLERPLSSTTLCTTLQAALRARRRQYQARDLIEEQKRVAEALRHSRQEVLQRNADLELQVAQRTEELSAANKELDAFCYSVSHDLRAPLRAIDGFAMTVLEHCDGKLDPTARTYIDRARSAAQRMQRLIDDLLALSRLSRTPMTLEHIDLTALANAVLQELRRKHPERTGVQTAVAAGLQVWADAALLRIALDNLLGNAWKFTARQENALIELGLTIAEGVPVFFVRDNGVGFDMAYAAKLFVPFQRLHNNHDFPGSGIGLAIVQRIMRRHEGEVWAEGWPGKGACVYFRLSPEPVRTTRESTGQVSPGVKTALQTK